MEPTTGLVDIYSVLWGMIDIHKSIATDSQSLDGIYSDFAQLSCKPCDKLPTQIEHDDSPVI
ncbi:hypothetical protein GBAR_LOCUS24768 [Geodia barretti]|uniref:Uncharacterized protein n=1 Tax=Geodia barretti TaxID=519541 RepID=A0AA35TAE0_GEOBA|nr:hypothetical protein GBAR_LOCUS24768 [Geodia barretti]